MANEMVLRMVSIAVPISNNPDSRSRRASRTAITR
jgi:hypothetical protein